MLMSEAIVQKQRTWVVWNSYCRLQRSWLYDIQIFLKKLIWSSVRIWAFCRGTDNTALKLDTRDSSLLNVRYSASLKLLLSLMVLIRVRRQILWKLNSVCQGKGSTVEWFHVGSVFGRDRIFYTVTDVSRSTMAVFFDIFLRCLMISWYIADGEQRLWSGGDGSIFPQLVWLPLL